jgi:hypothetical protein
MSFRFSQVSCLFFWPPSPFINPKPQRLLLKTILSVFFRNSKAILQR